jgi:hypothetical protein
MIEFCCDPISHMGKVGPELGVNVIRLYNEKFDLMRPEIIEQLLELVGQNPGISIWGSIP